MKRECRYIVLKRRDVFGALNGAELQALDDMCMKVRHFRADRGAPPMACVVVEADWPEYEPTWAAIASRVDAENTGLSGGTPSAEAVRSGKE